MSEPNFFDGGCQGCKSCNVMFYHRMHAYFHHFRNVCPKHLRPFQRYGVSSINLHDGLEHGAVAFEFDCGNSPSHSTIWQPDTRIIQKFTTLLC